jgi:phospholipid/cholesterol/gamma-HCH transport system permease protein
LLKPIEFIGEVSLFASQVIRDIFRPPFEAAQIARQMAEIGSKSLTLVIASGFALGTVMTFHTRSTLVTFGAGSHQDGDAANSGLSSVRDHRFIGAKP